MIEVTGNQIATNKITIKELFADDMWFNIPEYQRPYVWGSDQITSLLDDISYAAVNTPDNQYFLGSLVIQCESEKQDDTSFVDNIVLDGQQRLTTLYILHAIIRDTTDKETRRTTCAQTIFQKGNPDDGIPERLRLEFAIRSELGDFINTYIKVEGGTNNVDAIKSIKDSTKNTSIRNIAKAILIIKKWLSDTNNLHVDELFPYLRKYVILIYVASNKLEDAFRLFTVLNDRGVKLRNSDILKSQNLSQVLDNEKRKKYAIYWEELEGDLGESFDQFLSYLRTILVKEKARNNLLKEFQENIYDPKSYDASIKKFTPTKPLLTLGASTFDYIKNYKEHYDQIFSTNNFHLNKSWYFDNLICILQDTSFSDIWIPPLLAFRNYFGDVCLSDFLTKLDNKFSGDWISQETLSKRIDGMNNIIKKIEYVKSKFNNNTDSLNDLFNSNVFNFNESEFIRQLSIGTIYGRSFGRYILRKVDFILDAPVYSEKRNSYNTMSVEHILPQTPKDNSQWVIDFSVADREEWTNKLGNLVLISRRKNTQQGRLDFKDKKEKYFSSSIESFPNSLQVMQKQKWDLSELKVHHEQLISKIKNHYKIGMIRTSFNNPI
jgi:uncharacterized protein with ParB-like and HNH nuclease domain